MRELKNFTARCSWCPSFDIEAIKEAGYSVVTPVIVTNSADYEAVESVKSGQIDLGQKLLDIR